MRALETVVDILVFYKTNNQLNLIGHRRNFIFDSCIAKTILMVRLFKSSDSIEIQKKGYSAKYVADVDFRKKLDSGGFILITIPAGAKTEPHTHRDLEEVFIILSDLKMKVDLVEYELEKGDVVLVNPNETHSFIAVLDSPANIIAIKFPNLKNDRVSLDTQ